MFNLITIFLWAKGCLSIIISCYESVCQYYHNHKAQTHVYISVESIKFKSDKFKAEWVIERERKRVVLVLSV